MTVTVDDDLGRDRTAAVVGRDRRSSATATIRDYLDRRSFEAAAAWRASLDGDKTVALAEFDATW